MTSNEDKFLNSNSVSDKFFSEIAEIALKISRETFKIRLVLLSPAAAASDNFVSVLYRAKIKIEMLETGVVQSVDVIIKVLLTSIKEITEFNVFPREKFYYENIIPSFEKLYRDIAGEEIEFGPRSIKFESEPYEIIVLEDLKVRNFKMMNRKVGFPEQHVKIVLKKLAYMHAASAVRYHTVFDFFLLVLNNY